jgi:uncharacterized protein YdeI (YjbR/CyaY-like superfamily)
MIFRGSLDLHGKTATGISVPDGIIEALGGQYLLGVNAENRAAAGDELDVEIALDTQPREVTVPDDLAAAIDADHKASATFDDLSYTHRKEWVRWVEESKKPETRQTRVEKTVAALHEGKRTR